MRRLWRYCLGIVFLTLALGMTACKTSSRYYLSYEDNVKVFIGDKEIAKNQKVKYNTTVLFKITVPIDKEIAKVTIDNQEVTVTNNAVSWKVVGKHRLAVTFKEKANSVFTLTAKNTTIDALIKSNAKRIFYNGIYHDINTNLDPNKLVKGQPLFLFVENNDSSKKLSKFLVNGIDRKSELINAIYRDENNIETKTQILKLVVQDNIVVESVLETKKYLSLTLDNNIILPSDFITSGKITDLGGNKYRFEQGETYPLSFKKIENKMVTKIDVAGENKTNLYDRDLNIFTLEALPNLDYKTITITYGDYIELVHVTLDSNLQFKDATINPRTVTAGQAYEFVITPPTNKKIAKILANNIDLVNLVKDNTFSYKVTQNIKFTCEFAEFKDDKEFNLTTGANIELVDGLKTGKHKIGTKISFKLKEIKKEKFVDEIRANKYQFSIDSNLEYIYFFFLNSDTNINVVLRDKPNLYVDNEWKDNVDFLDGIQAGMQEVNTTIKFKLKNLEPNFDYIVKINGIIIKADTDGVYQKVIIKNTLTIKLEKNIKSYLLHYDPTICNMGDTPINYKGAVAHGVEVIFTVKTVEGKTPVVKINGTIITATNNKYRFAMDKETTIEVTYS